MTASLNTIASPTSFSSAVSDIQQSLNQFIVTPLNAFGLGGFVFDVEGTTIANFTADITDHYAEDNSVIQDHIAVRPKRITLKNYVGELVYRLDNSTDTVLQNVVQKLTTISAFLPTLATGASQAVSASQGVSNYLSTGNFPINGQNESAVLQSATSLFAAVKNLIPPTTRQQQAYLFFKSLMQQKILFSVQTPFEFMSNMAIEGIVATQREESKYISDFSITLKEIRFAATSTTTFNSNQFQSNADPTGAVNSGGQTPQINANNVGIQDITQNGAQSGAAVPQSSTNDILTKTGLSQAEANDLAKLVNVPAK